jgi:hypothetical protein
MGMRVSSSAGVMGGGATNTGQKNGVNRPDPREHYVDRPDPGHDGSAFTLEQDLNG